MDEVVSGDGFSEIIFDYIDPKAGREYEPLSVAPLRVTYTKGPRKDSRLEACLR